MIGKDRALEILQNQIKRSEADQAEAVLLAQDKGLTRFANSIIHQNVSETSNNVIFRAAMGQKIGIASTTSLEADDLARALGSAEEIAAQQVPNPDFQSLPGKDDYKEVETYFEQTGRYSPTARTEKIKGIIERAGAKGLMVAGSFATGSGEIAVVNSLGVAAYQPITSAVITVVATSDDSSGYAHAYSRDVADIDFEQIAEVATEKCLLGEGPKEIPIGSYDVVLEEVAVANLLEWTTFIGLGAKGLQEGTSFMCDRLGQRIMGENVTLYDDGTDMAGIAMPFDLEGQPKRKVVLIDGGVAAGVVYDSITAQKEDRETTGHSLGAVVPEAQGNPLPTNLFMSPGDSSTEEMIQATEKGILITRFHYINGLLDTRRALLTGMTRDGTFLIEDGKIRHPIKNLRFTESVLRAFSNIELISRKNKIVSPWWEDIGAIVVPSVKIKDFTFTGTTG